MWRSEEHPSWFLTISNDACQCHIGFCNGTVTVLRFLEAQPQSNVSNKEKLHDDNLRWGHGRAGISRGICIPAKHWQTLIARFAKPKTVALKIIITLSSDSLHKGRVALTAQGNSSCAACES
jgi:hypothetical protein